MLIADVEWGSGQVFLVILWVFLFVVWFWLLMTVIADLFRDHATSGWVKALWVIFIVILPFLGVLVYLIARSRGMAERALVAQQQAEKQFGEYVRTTAGMPGASTADEIAKLANLRDKGAISNEEFASAKAKLL